MPAGVGIAGTLMNISSLGLKIADGALPSTFLAIRKSRFDRSSHAVTRPYSPGCCHPLSSWFVGWLEEDRCAVEIMLDAFVVVVACGNEICLCASIKSPITCFSEVPRTFPHPQAGQLYRADHSCLSYSRVPSTP